MATVTMTDAKEEIRRTNREFGDMVRDRQYDGIAEFYTRDAVLLPQGFEMLKGSNAIRDFWKKVPAELGVRDVTLETQSVEQREDLAIEMGRYHMETNDGPDDGKYIVVWKRENDRLKIHMDIWNSDRPQV
jgi:ketosteroid isomerase-like protein